MPASDNPTAPPTPLAPPAGPSENPIYGPPPTLGEAMLYFESSPADDRMVGRPCRVVEDVGEGRYDIDVDYFRTDTAAGKPDTARLRDVPFFAGDRLPRDKTGRFWLWPSGKNFFARATPVLSGAMPVVTPPRLTHTGHASSRPPAPPAPAPTTPAARNSSGAFMPKPERREPRDNSSNQTGLVKLKEGAKLDE